MSTTKSKAFSLASLASAFLLAVGPQLPSVAYSATVIKLAHPNVPKHPMGVAFESFKEIVETKSGGDIKVTVYDSGKFGDDAAIAQGVRTGAIQMGSSSTPNLVPMSKRFGLFDLPYLFKCYAAADVITDGPIGKSIATALEETGAIGLGYIDIGFRQLFNSKRAIRTLEDAKGLKVRATGSRVHVATLKALGTNPTPISWSEVYTALQQKTVDGVDIDLNLAWFNNFPDVNKYVVLSHATYSPHLVMINKKFYEGLDADKKSIVDDAFKEIQKKERDLIRSNESMIIDKMKQNGVEVTEMDNEEAWANAVKPVYEAFSADVGEDLIEQVRSSLKGACG